MIELDWEAMDRERFRGEREKQLVKEVYMLNYLKQLHTKATTNWEAAVKELHRTKEDVEAQESLIEGLMRELPFLCTFRAQR